MSGKHNGTPRKISVEWITDAAGQPVWLDALWDGTRWNGFPNVRVDRNVRDRIYGIGEWEGTLDPDFFADLRNPDGTFDIPPLNDNGMACLGGGACCVEMKEEPSTFNILHVDDAAIRARFTQSVDTWDAVVDLFDEDEYTEHKPESDQQVQHAGLWDGRLAVMFPVARLVFVHQEVTS